VGTAFYSIVVSGLIYLGLNWLWIHSVKKEKKEKEASRRQRKQTAQEKSSTTEPGNND